MVDKSVVSAPHQALRAVTTVLTVHQQTAGRLMRRCVLVERIRTLVSSSLARLLCSTCDSTENISVRSASQCEQTNLHEPSLFLFVLFGFVPQISYKY